MFNTSPRQQYRDFVMGLGVSDLLVNHASCIPSLSCLPFFLYHPYIPLCLNSDFEVIGKNFGHLLVEGQRVRGGGLWLCGIVLGCQ